MKVMTDIIRTAPLIIAIALGIVGIFYLSKDGGLSPAAPIVTDAAARNGE